MHSTFWIRKKEEEEEGKGGRRRKGESESESDESREWKERKRRRRRWEELGRSDHHHVSYLVSTLYHLINICADDH